MSWAVTYRAEPGATIEQTAAALRELPPPESGAFDTEAETAAQFETAREVAIAILEHGAVGAGPFQVVMGGHANPNHESRPGYSPDSIHISINGIA